MKQISAPNLQGQSLKKSGIRQQVLNHFFTNTRVPQRKHFQGLESNMFDTKRTGEKTVLNHQGSEKLIVKSGHTYMLGTQVISMCFVYHENKLYPNYQVRINRLVSPQSFSLLIVFVLVFGLQWQCCDIMIKEEVYIINKGEVWIFLFYFIFFYSKRTFRLNNFTKICMCCWL